MTRADPWDEIARLEKQMDAELLAQLEDSRANASKARKASAQAPVGEPKR